MKKVLALIAVLGAAVGGAALVAKKRGQDLGELAGEWADRAKEAASGAGDRVDDALVDLDDGGFDLDDELTPADKS